MVLGAEEGDILRTPGNSFMLEFSKVLSFSEKTAFIIHDKDILDFNKENLRIYFQSGNLFTESKLEKINISDLWNRSSSFSETTWLILSEYLFAFSNSIFNLVIGALNIGVWVFFRDMKLISLIQRYKHNH